MMDLTELKKPFQAREHKFNYENWAYIDEDAISTRLDDVCGMDGWQLVEKTAQQITQTHWTVTVELSIMTENGWVIRSGTGEGTTAINKPYKKDGKIISDPLEDPRYVSNMGENAKKGAATDAFRRAARLWGIGRYLLQLPKNGNKPAITSEGALHTWLVQNFKKDGAGTGSTTATDAKPEEKATPPTPKAEKKPDAPSEIERLARSPYAKPVYKIEYDTNSRATPRYNAWWKPDADGQPCKIVLFNEHCAEISNALRLDWEAGKNGRYPTRSFNTAIDIFTIWYEKGNYAKFDTVDHSFKSEAVRMRFFEMFERYNPSDLKKALNVEKSAEYDGGLSKAIEAVDDYFEGKVDADLQAMDDAPGNVTQIKSAYSQSVEKTKQKQMAGLPAYENLG